MSDVIIQVLLIFAYLAIGIIAVTFPIYAICVTYLPQERWESEKERKKRIEKLRAKISDLTAELKGEKRDSVQVIQLKEQIGRYETELKRTELRADYLTAKGAVGVPVSYLASALLAVGISIYFFHVESLEGIIFFGFLSAFFSAMAVYRLYKTISAVEYAALRPARTVEFNIGFLPDLQVSKQVKGGEKSEIRIFATTSEDDAEECTMFVKIPSEIEVISIPRWPNARITEHPDHTTIWGYFGFRPKNTEFGILPDVVARKTGKYTIDVKLCAKGMYEVNKELTLEVIK